MEWKVYKDTVTTAKTICDTKLELPIETELLIPDYLPQVFKIVKCFVDLVVLQKQAVPGRLTVEGYLRCVVYYQADTDGSLCQAEQKLPVVRQLDIEAGDWALPVIHVTGQAEYVNCRAVNQRRVDIRGAYGLTVTAVAQTDTQVVTALEGAGLQQKLAPLAGLRTLAVPEKLITAEEQVTFEAEPEMILTVQCAGAVTEARALAGKAVVKGEIRAEVIYRTGPGQALLHTVRQIPFHEVLDADGADETCQCFAAVQPTGCTITAAEDPAEGQVLSATALLSAQVYRTVEHMAVCDAFSTTCDTQLIPAELTLGAVADVFTQQVEAVAAGQLPDESARIIDALATPLPVEVLEQNGEAVLRGRVMAHLLCESATGEVDCYDKVCEYILPHHYPGPASALTVRCWPAVTGVSARMAGGETSAAVLLTVQGMVTARAGGDALADVQNTGPRQRAEGAALRVYFANAGEDLFDIAKRYAASPQAIAAANQVEEGLLEEPRRLLIPSGT